MPRATRSGQAHGRPDSLDGGRVQPDACAARSRERAPLTDWRGESVGVPQSSFFPSCAVGKGGARALRVSKRLAVYQSTAWPEQLAKQLCRAQSCWCSRKTHRQDLTRAASTQSRSIAPWCAPGAPVAVCPGSAHQPVALARAAGGALAKARRVSQCATFSAAYLQDRAAAQIDVGSAVGYAKRCAEPSPPLAWSPPTGPTNVRRTRPNNRFTTARPAGGRILPDREEPSLFRSASIRRQPDERAGGSRSGRTWARGRVCQIGPRPAWLKGSPVLT